MVIVCAHSCVGPQWLQTEKRWGKNNVLSAVVWFILVRCHCKWAYCLHFLPTWKQRFLWNIGAVLPNYMVLQEDCNVDENITSHKIQQVPPFDNMSSTKHPNKCVILNNPWQSGGDLKIKPTNAYEDVHVSATFCGHAEGGVIQVPYCPARKMHRDFFR